MISSTQTLPDGYCQTDEIDLSKNKGLALLFNVVGGILFILSLVLMGVFLDWARPELSTGTLHFKLDLFQIIGWVASVALMIVVHELIHGFFFWAFTRSLPRFALHLRYAYAAAPDWFLPARQYWIVGVAPLVLIGVTGLLLLVVVPVGWIPILAFFVVMNTAGSVGDLFIVARLLRLSPGSLVKDAGDSVSFFEPAP